MGLPSQSPRFKIDAGKKVVLGRSKSFLAVGGVSTKLQNLKGLYCTADLASAKPWKRNGGDLAFRVVVSGRTPYTGHKKSRTLTAAKKKKNRRHAGG